jgi:lipopolysaccharide/colanic/teichoic acid biosynthesis glycosyltransferase
MRAVRARAMTAARDDVLKRTIDIVGSAVLLVLTAPVMGVTALAVAVTMGRPVLFRQQRPGRDGRIFRLRKFRTMLPVDARQGLVTDAQRLTRLGAWLRSTSLDELPSLLNVLTGDMSFVGPRPLLVDYLQRYTTEQARRHEVRPGITGLAQVDGRNALSWERRLELDVIYVDNRSFLLDMRILVRTVTVVFARTGITDADGVSMREFRGGDAS